MKKTHEKIKKIKKIKNIKIIKNIKKFYPDVQAIYIFGSFGTEFEKKESDVDIAVLLPHQQAKDAGFLSFSECKESLENFFGKTVDLINLRQVSTVLQKEIILADRQIFCSESEKFEVEKFEMLVCSYYQKLNEERKEILHEITRTGRIL
jgi:predicted nucleotidyltransferase